MMRPPVSAPLCRLCDPYPPGSHPMAPGRAAPGVIGSGGHLHLPARIVHNRSTRAGMILAALVTLGARVTSGAAAGEFSGLQRAVDRALDGHQGCAVVLDVESDRLLARYDLDLAARRLVAPGSTLKPFTLL